MTRLATLRTIPSPIRTKPAHERLICPTACSERPAVRTFADAPLSPKALAIVVPAPPTAASPRPVAVEAVLAVCRPNGSTATAALGGGQVGTTGVSSGIGTSRFRLYDSHVHFPPCEWTSLIKPLRRFPRRVGQTLVTPPCCFSVTRLQCSRDLPEGVSRCQGYSPLSGFSDIGAEYALTLQGGRRLLGLTEEDEWRPEGWMSVDSEVNHRKLRGLQSLCLIPQAIQILVKIHHQVRRRAVHDIPEAHHQARNSRVKKGTGQAHQTLASNLLPQGGFAGR